MDNQTNYPNQDENNNQDDRPLTSFLHARQAVRTDEPPEEQAEFDTAPAWPSAEQDAEEGQDADNAEDDSRIEESESDEDTDSGNSQFGDILSDGLGLDEADIDTAEDEEFGTDEQEEGDDEEGEENQHPSAEVVQNKLNVALKALRQMEEQISTVIGLLESGSTMAAEKELSRVSAKTSGGDMDAQQDEAIGTAVEPREDLATLKPIDGRVVEGVFDGRGMVGSDGKNYLVPPNYASKSKLVEGDMLKLTITPKGSFIYKQIGPIERSRLIGQLGYDYTTGEFYAVSDNRRWSVLKASVTYFKGEDGDEAVLLVPKNAPSKWAAVENIIKKNPLG